MCRAIGKYANCAQLFSTNLRKTFVGEKCLFNPERSSGLNLRDELIFRAH